MTTILERYYPEERRVMRSGPASVTDIPCMECGQPLIETAFAEGTVRLCDNHLCHLFRTQQGIKVRRRSRTLARYNHIEKYLRFLRNTSGCYHQLTSLGFAPKFAKRFQSTKQTKRITKMVERGLSKDFIYRAMTND